MGDMAALIQNNGEWQAVYEALSEYTENEQCREDVDCPYAANPRLVDAERVLDRMNAEIEALAEAPEESV